MDQFIRVALRLVSYPAKESDNDIYRTVEMPAVPRPEELIVMTTNEGLKTLKVLEVRWMVDGRLPIAMSKPGVVVFVRETNSVTEW